MTLDDLTGAEYLEQLAAALKRLEGRVETLDRVRLEELLGGPAGSRAGGIGMPEMRAGASDIDRTLGNVLPFYGQTNLLRDPSLEQFEDVSDILTTENTWGAWRAKYVLDAGSAPANKTIGRHFFRGSDYDPFNSDIVQLSLQSLASGTSTWYVYPATGFVADASVATLPYLVASVRVGDFGLTLNTLTNITSITVTLQIIDASDNVEAESQALDFKAMVGRRPEIQQLVAAFTPGAETYRWRLKVVLVASGTGGAVRVKFGEPMLHYAYSPDPTPFSPVIGRWVPDALERTTVKGGSAPIIETSLDASGSDLFLVWGDGTMEWADGAGGAIDARIRRGSSGGLVLKPGAAAFPTGPATNDVFYRTDIGMWFFYDGTRWMCTCLHDLPLTRPDFTALSATAADYSRVYAPHLHGGSDIMVVSFWSKAHIASGGTALGASHKWVGTLNKFVAGATSVAIATLNVDSGSSNNYRSFTTAANDIMNGGTERFIYTSTWTKTGTPGNLQPYDGFSYRVIAT